MMGTPAALAWSKNSPNGAAIFEQTCLGSSQRAFISRTNIAVVLLSKVRGFASGRFGPSCAPNPRHQRRDKKTRNDEFKHHVRFSMSCDEINIKPRSAIDVTACTRRGVSWSCEGIEA